MEHQKQVHVEDDANDEVITTVASQIRATATLSAGEPFV
jgi:hypothetical protein